MDKKHIKIAEFLLRLCLIVFLCIMAGTISGCSMSLSKPVLQIKTPADEVAAGDVTISVDVSNFELVTDTGLPNEPLKGHIIYYLDTPIPVYFDHLAISRAGTYFVSNETSYTWKGVTPGIHTFSAQLVNKNNTPLPASVVDKLTINVGAPTGKPSITMTPVDGSPLVPGKIVLAVTASNFILSSKDAGVVNRNGEGHLIYYIDVPVPVDPGVPAVTETSIVSANATHIWKPVTAGTHTFSAQLVNNDDTPLNDPVFVTITIDVKP